MNLGDIQISPKLFGQIRRLYENYGNNFLFGNFNDKNLHFLV